MFITRKRHNMLLAAAQREIEAYQEAARRGREQFRALEAENELLAEELAPYRATRAKQLATLAKNNAKRTADAQIRKAGQ